MSLKERIAVSSDELVYDVELGLKRVKLWKSELSFADTDLFAKKLANEGISEDQFCRILGQTVASVPLTWVKEIQQRYENLGDKDIRTLLSGSSLSTHPNFGFLNAIAPFLTQGMIKLETGLNNIQNIPEILSDIHDPKL